MFQLRNLNIDQQTFETKLFQYYESSFVKRQLGFINSPNYFEPVFLCRCKVWQTNSVNRWTKFYSLEL